MEKEKHHGDKEALGEKSLPVPHSHQKSLTDWSRSELMSPQ